VLSVLGVAEDFLFRIANVGGVNEFSNMPDDELQKLVAQESRGTGDRNRERTTSVSHRMTGGMILGIHVAHITGRDAGTNHQRTRRISTGQVSEQGRPSGDGAPQYVPQAEQAVN